MSYLDSLKNYFTSETIETMEKELEAYSKEHPDEKIRFENVSTGKYVSAKKLKDATDESSRLQEEIEKLKSTISASDSDASDQIKKLQEQIESMTKEKALRDAESRLNERFNAAKGTNEFVNSFTENGVRDAFKAAIESEENSGKSDAEVYAEVVKQLGDVYKNPHKPSDIPPMGKDVDDVFDAEKFNGMTLEEQMKFANKHSKQYHEIFKE